MTSSDHHREAKIRRLAEASVWRVRLSQADLESSREFEVWLASDPENPAAWARVQAPWAVTEDSATSPEMMDARRDALDRARRAASRRSWGSRPRWWLGSVAAAVVICLAATLLLSELRIQQFRYQTPLGKREAFTLPDGSRVMLDAATTLDVRYSPRYRRIRLVEGQARFKVAHNAARPFIVYAEGQKIVDVGTDFNVDLVGPSVIVTLIMGRVTVAQANRSHHPPIMLRPGEQLVASPSLPVHVQFANTANATAWEDGLLVFHNEKLGSVVAAVGRYSEHPIRADAPVRNLKISGVFKEGDIATFLDVITHYLPVTERVAPNGAITLHRKT